MFSGLRSNKKLFPYVVKSAQDLVLDGLRRSFAGFRLSYTVVGPRPMNVYKKEPSDVSYQLSLSLTKG